MKAVLALIAVFVSASCSMTRGALSQTETSPQTEAAKQQGPTYSYRPLDPLSASLQHAAQVPVTNCRILELFPDETVRLAIGQFDVSGKVSYGVANAGYQGQRYTVVLDYIISNTVSLSAVTARSPDPKSPPSPDRQVPTYVGVGLRLSANLVVNSGTVDLANLIAIGAAAQAKQITGTLVFQTMGVSGESISAAVPIPSEISQSSIQNALVAIGTIKSKIFDDRTTISPRVIGIYDVFGTDTKAFDVFFAALLNNPPQVWEREKSSHCPGSPSNPSTSDSPSATGSSLSSSSSSAATGAETNPTAAAGVETNPSTAKKRSSKKTPPQR